MGGSVQRLEVLLVGALMLMIGVVAAAMMLLRLPAQPALTQATALPAHTTQTIPTAPTAGIGATRGNAAEEAAAPALRLFLKVDITNLRDTSWPIALLAVGAIGLALTVRRRCRQRMAYTGQSVRMLLGAADAPTRSANLRVLRDLQAQGSLPLELASAMRKWHFLALPAMPKLPPFPRRALPRLKLPAISLPRLSLRVFTVRRQSFPAPALTLAPVAPLPVDDQGQSILIDPLADAAADAGAREMSDLLPATDGPLPELASLDPAADSRAARWSAEDRALAVAGALESIWSERSLSSPILAVDTNVVAGAGQVVITVDPIPDEEERLVDVPEALGALRPGWRSRWKMGPNGMAQLVVDGSTLGEPPCGGPLLAPVLMHSRGDTTMRFFPLAAWRHLAIYGGEALGALHAILSGLLYAQSPRDLALAICDAGQITPLYRDVAHLVAALGDPAETLNAVAQAVRRPPASSAVRPVVIVVVEPDAATLAALAALLKRLRHEPAVPVHLLVTQEHLSAGGREAYAMLPALITASGQGPALWLPGQGDWPRPGMSRLVGRGLRVEGRAPRMSEMEIAEVLAPMRRRLVGLAPVIWERTPAKETCRDGDQAEVCDARPQHLLPASTPLISGNAGREVDGWLGVGLGVGVANNAAASTAAQTRRGEAFDSEALARETSRGVIAQPAGDPAISAAAPNAVGEGLALDRADEAIAWPVGPGSMDAEAVAALFDAVLGAPAIVGGAKPGVSRGRLRPLLQPEHQPLAATLLCWMDRAAVLVEPVRDTLRWREPRPLASHDLRRMAKQLADTAIPDAAAVQAMVAGSAPLSGRAEDYYAAE